jgi:hypothetical protein
VSGRRGCRGQAAVELLVAIPALVMVALLAWQLVAVVAAGFRAERRLRAEGLAAVGASGRTVLVSVAEGVPAVLPGAEGLRLVARAAVRAP